MTFRLPPYPYDRLDGLAKLAAALPGGMVDCSIGTPCDPPLPAVVEALAASGTERGYPASAGSPQLREAAAAWLDRRFGLGEVPLSSVAACVGTKELVASVPHVLRLREPEKDTVLYPAVSYPTYAMGAELAGCRAVAVPSAARARRRASTSQAIDDVGRGAGARAVVELPFEPHGGLGDLGAEAAWGRAHGRARVLRRVLRRVHLGRARRARCSSTAPTAWWPCTRCPSVPTSPGSGSASTPATPSWWSSCARYASTPV